MATTTSDAITSRNLFRLTEPQFFAWATGIEDTFIVAPHEKNDRLLDEYLLTQHYSNWRNDLDLAASLGIGFMRYGIPWYRLEPGPGRFDFEIADRAFEHLLECGIQPIVDLMHYGTPPWLTGSFSNPDYPKRVAEYAAAVAERYRGRVFWYTPLNEPRITSYYCGKLGWWPPYGRSWRGFLSVMLAVSRGIVETTRALKSVDDRIVAAHVDATDLYIAADESVREQAELRQRLVFLALDLVSGKVGKDHALIPWLSQHGATDEDLTWFTDNAVKLDLVGLNLYPMYTHKVLSRSGGRITTKMKYAEGSLLIELGRAYWQRYGVPLFVSETASVKSKRGEWLEQSIEAVRRLRADGIPMFGYTWWPLFALVGWGYRQGRLDLNRYLLQFGLWDLVQGQDDRLMRVETPIAQRFRTIVGGGIATVGPLRRPI